MPSLKKFALLVPLLLLSCYLLAQEPQPASTNQAFDDDNQIMVLPTPLLAATPSLAFEPELDESNFLNGGLAIGSSFDDNVLSSTSDRASDFAYSVAPYIGLSQSRSRLNWSLNYMAGFLANQRYSALNQGSHDLYLQGLYRIAPHANLRLFDSFRKSTGFFDQASQPADFSTSGILDRPNASIVTPLSRQTANTSTAEIDDQFSASSMIGASGSFHFSHFGNTPGGYQLIDSESTGGQAFYEFRVSARNMVGLTYRFQRFSFSPITDGAVAHSIFLMYTVRVKPALALSFFAGPEQSNTYAGVFTGSTPAGGTVSQRNWSSSGGGTFNWSGRRNSVIAEFIREITDGGGLLGVVRANIADVGVRRQLTHSLGASVWMAYATNDSLISDSTLQPRLNTASASMTFDRSLGNHVDLKFGYMRNYQQRFAGPVLADVNHNRAWVSVQYDFSRPLGR